MDEAETVRTPLRPRRAAAAALVAAAVAAGVLARRGLDAWSVVEAAAAAVLVWVAAIDLETQRLPDRIVLPTTVAVLVACGITGAGVVEHLVAAVGAAAFLFVMAIVRPGDLGMGDVKLVALLGALLGRGVVWALVIGFVLVAAAALVLVLRDGRSALRRHVPLGPFLAAGAVVVLLVGGG